MKEVIISENVTSIVEAKKIIDSISVINSKLDDSKNAAENLIKSVNDSSKSLQKAKDDKSLTRKAFGWSSESLLDFIIESNNATHSSVTHLSKFIKNSNENTKLLAEMIGKLAMLSGLSFEKISGATAELEELANNLTKTSGGNIKQAGQLKQVIISHINKIKEEKNKADKIEFNFGVVNDNLKKLNEKLDAYNIENQERIILIQKLINSKSENHFVKIQNKQRKLINYLGIFSLFTFSIIFLFLVYFFFYM